MKKIVYLLVVLCIGGVGLAQATSTYDYDRLPTSDNLGCSSVLSTITTNTDEQTIIVPKETYGRFTLFETRVDVRDMIIEFESAHSNSESPIKLQIFRTDKAGVEVDVQHWEENPIQLKAENGEGETFVEVGGGVVEYTKFRVLKLVWQDPNGETQSQVLGKIY